MKCQHCGENEATVHLTQVVGGKITKTHYCEQCARKEGVPLEAPASIADLLMSAPALLAPARAAPASCPRCGFTRAEFKKASRLGCAKCYETFAQDLAPVIESLHHATRHGGKRPSRADQKAALAEEREALKESLKKAIASENYEEAARLRDRLRQRKDPDPVAKEPG